MGEKTRSAVVGSPDQRNPRPKKVGYRFGFFVVVVFAPSALACLVASMG